MKLICLLTHGLGDWYTPLATIPSIMRKRNITDLKIYVDSIYFASNSYMPQRETGIKMIESIRNNGKSFIVVSHDLPFLKSVSNKILNLK